MSKEFGHDHAPQESADLGSSETFAWPLRGFEQAKVGALWRLAALLRLLVD